MKKDNVVRDKSYEFALNIINIIGDIQKKEKEYILTKQCIRSGTSIGANIAEASAGQSRRDFLSKMAIASKEARETHYWLMLLRDSRYLANREATILLNQCLELMKLTASIVKTTSINS